jgi:molecular chaperone Hsp33
LRTGITEAIFQDLARDLAYFLSLSFQIETALAVGLNMPPEEPVQVPSASGLLMQPLPGCDPMDFDRVRQAVETQSFRDWLEAEPRAAGDILGRVALDEAPRYYGELEPEYTCQCSREKADNILRMIDPEELTDMIEKDGQAEINCHFCADSYLFSKVELREILRQSQAGNA